MQSGWHTGFVFSGFVFFFFSLPSQNSFQVCVKLFLFVLPPLLYVFAAEGKGTQRRH